MVQQQHSGWTEGKVWLYRGYQVTIRATEKPWKFAKGAVQCYKSFPSR